MESKKREKLAAMGMTLEEFERKKQEKAEAEKAKKREAKRNATDTADYKYVCIIHIALYACIFQNGPLFQ